MSPFLIWRRSISPSKWGYQFPQWWIFGASESNAWRRSKSAGRSSNPISIGAPSTAARPPPYPELSRVAARRGELLGLRGNERDGLAQVPHLVLREQRLV